MASETKQSVTRETINVTDEKVRIEMIKRATVEQFSEVEAQGIYTGYSSREVGWLDGNKLMKPSDVFGFPYDPGLYYSMRYNHPIIKTLMDFKMNSVSQLKYNIKPCDSEDIEAVLAAEAVDFYMNRMPYNSLNRFIADAYDRVGTFGHAIYEIVITDDGFFDLVYIPPASIQYLTLTEDNYYIESVTQNNGAGLITIPQWKLVWFGKPAFLGAYYGTADLRPLIEPFTKAEQLWSNFLSQLRFARGILIGKETDDGGDLTADSWRSMMTGLTNFYKGKDAPILLPRGLDLDFIAPDMPVSGYAVEVATYVDTAIRECLFASLNSLGINGVGARALGESFSVSDAEKFADHVGSFIDLLNGETSPHSNLLEFITETLGFDKRYTPYIEVENTIEVKPEGRIEKIVTLIEKGIITQQELGDENKRIILEDLGFSTKAFNLLHGEPE